MTRPVDLMIVGAQKAGTTSLKEYLGQHPGAVTHRQREMMYFIDPAEYARGYDAASAVYFPGAPDGQVRIAKAVGIMFLPDALRRLADHNAGARVIAVLRHPVERAYSAYWYCRRMGWEDSPSFEAGLAAEAERTSQDAPAARHTAYVARGSYAPQVERLYSVLGRDRVRAVLFEDLISDPAVICRELFTFAGLDAEFVPDPARRENRAGAARSELLARILSGTGGVRSVLRRMVPTGIGAAVKRRLRALSEVPFTPPPLSSGTRRALLERFADGNAKLATLIGRDLDRWTR